jgi:hypothetical protein
MPSGPNGAESEDTKRSEKAAQGMVACLKDETLPTVANPSNLRCAVFHKLSTFNAEFS